MIKRVLLLLGVFALVLAIAPAVAAHPDPGVELERPSNSAAPEARDASGHARVSSGPSAKVVTNLDLRGRGERFDAGATTDVWAHNGYAYTGTFGSLCGGLPQQQDKSRGKADSEKWSHQSYFLS